MLKRSVDFILAGLLLVIALPLLAVAAIIIKWDSEGPVIFRQVRMGRRFQSFYLLKLRTMRPSLDGPDYTLGADARITGPGRWLRRFKLDELPQLWNVLRGDMSLVGPRPRLPQHVVTVNMPYRPGLTGAATLAFRREEEMLSHLDPSQLDSFYRQHVTPLKTRLDTRYMCRATFWSDLRLLAATFLVCIASLRAPAAFRNLPAQRMDIQTRSVD